MAIVSYQVLPGRVRLIMRVLFSGANDGSFRFIVKAENGSNLTTRVLSLPNYTNNQTVMRDVSVSNGGTISITVTARNVFGVAEDEVVIEGLNVEPG